MPSIHSLSRKTSQNNSNDIEYINSSTKKEAVGGSSNTNTNIDDNDSNNIISLHTDDANNSSNAQFHQPKNVRFDEPSTSNQKNSETNSIASIKKFFRSRSNSDPNAPPQSDTSSNNTSTRRRQMRRAIHPGMRNLRDIHSEDESDDENFVSKIVNSLAQGGLAPGFIDSDLPKVQDIENDIPMVDYKEAARAIIGSHSNQKFPDIETDTDDAYSAYTDTTHETRSTESSLGNDSSKDDFTAPAMEHFDDNNGLDSDSDDDEEYDALMGEDGYVAPPKNVKGGVLGSLLKMYQNEDLQNSRSNTSISGISDTTDAMSSSDLTTNDFKSDTDTHTLERTNSKKSKLSSEEPLPPLSKKMSQTKKDKKSKKNSLSAKKLKKKLKRKKASLIKITIHIADLLQRHRFILRMCKGLMLYGAPTHRLEEYMIMTSRVLEVDGQFLYIPGCMIVSFGDATTRTSEVQLVRCSQGLNLWKLHQVHAIYKKVLKDEMGADEGNIQIDKILSDPNLYPAWLRVFLFGFCSSMVTPYAFGGHWINLAVTFFMGSCVGALQYVFAQRSSMYSNVFEITASIVVSFCGRAFGSIPNSNICFGSVTQGSLALILPGYIILCGSLELQSRNLVAGSVRMFYAIIYSLFLGFGITLGATLFGWMYKGASDETSCGQPISPWYRFIFVPAFVIGNSMLNQARWSQLPVMVTIACIGYVVTYFAGKHFENSTEFTAALAAFVIGVLGNVYARVWKGLAVSAMLPAIFCQVPSGVASQNSLLSGLQSANKIVKGNTTTIITDNDLTKSMSFGITMIEVSIGISVGLFASTLFVYPFGKTGSLFSL
ncbi:pheromone-regulated protein PRM10 KABA2_01S02442 [Maudiozyma barnettii]|uniref:Pheromone-regulated membrane protein 10 n=1 Tax=Maudiozyma barnettii TaxID=61262 RepID=A0A8H2ZFM7_9SACH|nr:similar to Torulaspora delbrueckii TDEL0D01230 hypothetical protein [Kazachstania barnettii]CAB4251945.1 similar to Torulaspora delbrueckii TDEL0D01230 hypothetical protein [Kazachstania barnettii]